MSGQGSTPVGPTAGPSEAAPATVASLVPWERIKRRSRRLDRALDALGAPAPLRAPAGSDPEPSLEDAHRTIAAAASLEVYFALKARGLQGALGVLSALTEPQVRTLFDLDRWRGDALAISDLLTWLEGFRVAGHAPLVRAARSLDPEALAALFRRRLHIAHVPRDDRSDEEPLPEWLLDPAPEIEPVVQTPDGRFFLAARVADERDALDEERDPALTDEEERKQVLGLVRELYLDESWEWVAGILRMALDDFTSALEEDAYRFRSGRLEDLGFPTRERALEVFQPADPADLDAPAPAYGALDDVRLPQPYLAEWSRGLLDEALGRLSIDRAARVESDLVALANAALVAEGVDPGDEPAVREVLDRARAYLELGLAHEAGDDPRARVEVAAERLARVHPSLAFRVGYTATLRLGARARAVLAHPGLAPLGSAALTVPEAAVLTALAGPRPRFGRALDDVASGGWSLNEARSEDDRPIRTGSDLTALEAFLARREVLLEASAELGVLEAPIDAEVLPTADEDRDLDLRLTTMGARALLSGRPDLTPLARAELVDLVDRLGAAYPERALPGAGPAADAVSALVAPERRPVLADRVRWGLGRLADELFPLVGQSALDPRFVQSVLRLPPDGRARPTDA